MPPDAQAGRRAGVRGFLAGTGGCRLPPVFTPLRVHSGHAEFRKGRGQVGCFEACESCSVWNTCKDIEHSAYVAGLNMQELDLYVGAPGYILRMPPPAQPVLARVAQLYQRSGSRCGGCAGMSLVGRLERKAVQCNRQKQPEGPPMNFWVEGDSFAVAAPAVPAWFADSYWRV